MINLDCQNCRLCKTRTQVVPGRGNIDAKIMFIGEAPGGLEDKSGRPFHPEGHTGGELKLCLEQIGVTENDVYLTNVVKCRPPGNRRPKLGEVNSCGGYLDGEVSSVGPDLIVALGRCAGERLSVLSETESIASARLERKTYKGIPVQVTYHPSYVARFRKRRKEFYEDIHGCFATESQASR